MKCFIRIILVVLLAIPNNLSSTEYDSIVATIPQKFTKGPYEMYMDSILETKEYINEWGNFNNFKDERQRRFVEYIIKAPSYDIYFGLLNEYLPIPSNDKSTEYDRYMASEIQIDSLLAFPYGEAGTAGIYSHSTYQRIFTSWTLQKVTDQFRAAGLYSVDVDSAWQNYRNAMLTAVDSVVMYRRHCIGTIGIMEYVAFAERLDDDFLSSMLDALYSQQRNIHHVAILDKYISEAYKTLRSHLKEHVPKNGFDDLAGCYIPLSERYAALDKDEETWTTFINARNRFASTLTGQQRKAYNNATNNLKRNKLWLLKNEYRCYPTSASIGSDDKFYDILLPFDCNDKELMKYNFQEHYKAVYGDYKYFN